MAQQKSTVSYASLREFLSELGQKKLVQPIHVRVEKDWDLGAVCREIADRDGSVFSEGTDPLPEQMDNVRRRWQDCGFRD